MVELLVSSAVMVVVLSVSTTVLTKSSTIFTQQRGALNGRNSAAASIDLLSRLLRQSSCISATNVYCQSIFPDPDNNGVFDSVRVRADWNPRDGALNDPYENVLFVVANGTLWKREPADAALVVVRRQRAVAALHLHQPERRRAGQPCRASRPDRRCHGHHRHHRRSGLPAVTSASTVSVRRIK